MPLRALVAVTLLFTSVSPVLAAAKCVPKRPTAGWYWNCKKWEFVPSVDARKREMEAEQRALKKMQEERRRDTPRTERCFLIGGKLDCKPG